MIKLANLEFPITKEFSILRYTLVNIDNKLSIKAKKTFDNQIDMGYSKLESSLSYNLSTTSFYSVEKVLTINIFSLVRQFNDRVLHSKLLEDFKRL